jgi:hypothetical protein
LLVAVLLGAATTAVYLPVVHHPFFNLDDNQYVTENLHVQAGLSRATVRWAFRSYDALNWHPLTWLSHAADVQMFGLRPAGHHAINLLLHVANVLLLFFVLQRATGFTGRSAMVAALFALHPINVESVAWIAERKNLLSMLFFLLALGSYQWYARRPALGRYAVVALWFALGLMAKPQVITLPFVLLLWDNWPLGRDAIRHSQFAIRRNDRVDTSGEQRMANGEWRFLILEKLPLMLMCVVSALLTMQAQWTGGAVVSLSNYSLPVRLENAVVSYARYLGKAFWPADLTLLYPHPGNTLTRWQVGLSLFLLLSITAAVWHWRERRYLLVGWLWFLGTLVPMIGIVQVGYQAMADRYAYLPFVGLFIMVCWGVADLFGPRYDPDRVTVGARLTPSVAIYALSTLVLFALAVTTRHQLSYWGDNLTLWSHVSDVIGENLIAEERMGDELARRGQEDEAIEHYSNAVEIKPTDADSNFALGVYEQKQGKYRDAIARYEIVVANAEKREMRTLALTYMSYAYRDLGDAERARESLEAAEKLKQ